MTKKQQRLLLALILGGGALAWTGNRFFWSCTWAARDISQLSLRGSVRVVSCNKQFWGRQEIVLALDSAATSQGVKEVAGLPGWRRTEDIPASTNDSVLGTLVGHHGVFRTNFDDFNHKGPDSFVSLDIDKRTLTVRRYEQ
jgi:hypothetical protein